MRREYLYGVLCAAVVAASFGGGYFAGKAAEDNEVKMQDENKEVLTNTVPMDEDFEEIIAQQEEIGIYYILKDEDKSLNLYKVENGEKTLIKEIEFDTKYLPADDRERLKKGIKLEDIEDGYELIEDFIS